MTDLVNNPPHYAKHAVNLEPIELCERLGFRLGNALKYCFRYQDKGTPQLDLRKAEYYVKRELEQQTATDSCWNWNDVVDFMLDKFSDKPFIQALRADGCEGLLTWIRQEIEKEDLARMLDGEDCKRGPALRKEIREPFAVRHVTEGQRETRIRE
jgi:hypothetical protein